MSSYYRRRCLYSPMGVLQHLGAQPCVVVRLFCEANLDV